MAAHGIEQSKTNRTRLRYRASNRTPPDFMAKFVDKRSCARYERCPSSFKYGIIDDGLSSVGRLKPKRR